jgi:hypothetical protein
MFGWFTPRSRTSRKSVQRVLAPVEEIAEQGVMVADVAVRLNVKNAIIMNALARQQDYSSERVAQIVRESLTELADERDADAAHLDAVAQEIDRFGRSGRAESDYGVDDNRTINHRRAVYRLVAQGLRARCDDKDYVRSTAEKARQAAWHEIGDSLKTRAEHPYYGGGSSKEYAENREERIRNLIEKDFPRLVRESRKTAED